MMRKAIFTTLSALILGAPLPSEAAPSGPRLVAASALKSTTITVSGRRSRISCLRATPGTATRSGTQMRFTSFDYLVYRTSPTQNRSAYDRYRSMARLGKTACSRLAALPRSSPTPTRTPTPAPTGNFDNNGNVTAAGKALFGIPSNLSANISTGRSLHTTYCTGCHTERTGRTFSNLRSNIARSPMLYDQSQIPDSQLAQITAYLNRFRP